MRRELVIASLVAACAGPRFLGEPIGRHCADERACRIWGGSVLDATAVGFYDHDPALREYIAGVADRVIQANHLRVRPRIEITAIGTASAEPEGAIYIRRDTLAVLGSEAALAAVLAHELVHLEAGTPQWVEPLDSDPEHLAWSRDIESIADERAVGFLITAGYDPRAMLDMLAAIARLQPGDDHTHPSELQREARVAVLIGDHASGELGRERYRAHVEGILVGDDPRFASVVDATVVSLAMGVAVVAGGERVHALVTTTARGDRITGALTDRRERRAAGLRVVIGVVPARVERIDASRQTIAAEALALVSSTLPAPEPGSHVVVVRGDQLDLWLELTGKDADTRATRLVERMRTPTAVERARIRPHHLRFRVAVASGTFEEIARRTCAVPDPRLDDPHRMVRAGEPIACLD